MQAKLLLSLAGALALAGCNNDSNDATTSTDTATPPPINATPSAASTTEAAPSTPQGFVDMAASSDMYEIEAAKLAQQMGKSDRVKAFATMMTTDHTKSSNDLKAAVGKAGNGLMVPTAMQAKHQANLDALKNAGDMFDTTYAQQQVAAHQEALGLLQDQAKSGTVAELKTFASNTAPVVQHHLDEAKKLP
jgi:putative membrane protein